MVAVSLSVIAVMLGIIAVELLAMLVNMRANMHHQKQTDVMDVQLGNVELRDEQVERLRVPLAQV